MFHFSGGLFSLALPEAELKPFFLSFFFFCLAVVGDGSHLFKASIRMVGWCCSLFFYCSEMISRCSVFFIRVTASMKLGLPSLCSGCQTRQLQWKNSDMEAAMEAVSTREMTISAAAKKFSVHRKTLDDRVKGHVVHGRRPGVSTILDIGRRNFFVIIPHLHGGMRISSYKDDGKSICLGNCQALWERRKV